LIAHQILRQQCRQRGSSRLRAEDYWKTEREEEEGRERRRKGRREGRREGECHLSVEVHAHTPFHIPFCNYIDKTL